jgi:Uma2 family endonuclease
MSRQVKHFLTPDEYLTRERKSEYKSEYFNGEVFAMTGASRNHNLIAINVASELREQLRSRPCEVYGSDMRVRIPTRNLYTYPDVVVVCKQPAFEDDYVDTLLNPALIVEVLSESAGSYDRVKKFGYYRLIDSLSEYLLVAQDEFRVEQYARQPEGPWLLSDIGSLDKGVELRSIQCSLEMKEIYEKVVLE